MTVVIIWPCLAWLPCDESGQAF